MITYSGEILRVNTIIKSIVSDSNSMILKIEEKERFLFQKLIKNINEAILAFIKEEDINVS